MASEGAGGAGVDVSGREVYLTSTTVPQADWTPNFLRWFQTAFDNMTTLTATFPEFDKRKAKTFYYLFVFELSPKTKDDIAKAFRAPLNGAVEGTCMCCSECKRRIELLAGMGDQNGHPIFHDLTTSFGVEVSYVDKKKPIGIYYPTAELSHDVHCGFNMTTGLQYPHIFVKFDHWNENITQQMKLLQACFGYSDSAFERVRELVNENMRTGEETFTKADNLFALSDVPMIGSWRSSVTWMKNAVGCGLNDLERAVFALVTGGLSAEGRLEDEVRSDAKLNVMVTMYRTWTNVMRALEAGTNEDGTFNIDGLKAFMRTVMDPASYRKQTREISAKELEKAKAVFDGYTTRLPTIAEIREFDPDNTYVAPSEKSEESKGSEHSVASLLGGVPTKPKGTGRKSRTLVTKALPDTVASETSSAVSVMDVVSALLDGKEVAAKAGDFCFAQTNTYPHDKNDLFYLVGYVLWSQFGTDKTKGGFRGWVSISAAYFPPYSTGKGVIFIPEATPERFREAHDPSLFTGFFQHCLKIQYQSKFGAVLNKLETSSRKAGNPLLDVPKEGQLGIGMFTESANPTAINATIKHPFECRINGVVSTVKYLGKRSDLPPSLPKAVVGGAGGSGVSGGAGSGDEKM